MQAVQILAHSPLIGRPVKGGKRELVIGRRSPGFVALYRFVPDVDTVFVLAIRGQREAGIKRGSRLGVEAHVRQLTKAGCKKLFRETSNGTKPDHGQLRKALAAVRDGDMLVVKRLDRLARSTLPRWHRCDHRP